MPARDTPGHANKPRVYRPERAEGPFDAVFIDADKVNYDRYGQWALANLKQGGLVIGDNAYLFGELMADKPDARAMRAFHALVARHCESVCAPTPS